MSIEIEDGTGSGKKVKVNGDNRLRVQAVTKTVDADVNELSGKVWSVPFEGLNPTGADDYVVYIKNTGDNNILISDVRIMADTAATQIELHAVSGTASGGTDVTPVPRTIGGSAIPSAVIQSGSDITGLTSDGVIFFMQCDTANKEYHLSTSSKIIIPKGKAFGLLVETGTANVTGVVSIFEDEVAS